MSRLLDAIESSDRVAALNDPDVFIRRVLDYEFTTFHVDWFKFQMDHPETIILAPRGHGKSTICTVAYSLWKLLHDPDMRILIVSNTADQADALSGEIRQQTERNHGLQTLFGDILGASWRANKFTTAGRTRICKEASITSVGVEGAVVSRHYDMIILDDIVDEENSAGETARRKLHTWYAKALMPCLEPGGELHLLGTRYHPRDLYGHILETAIFDDNRSIAIMEDASRTPALSRSDLRKRACGTQGKKGPA